MPHDHARAENIFRSLLEQPEGPARDEALERACAGDAGLRHMVVSMLASNQNLNELLKTVVLGDRPVIARDPKVDAALDQTSAPLAPPPSPPEEEGQPEEETEGERWRQMRTYLEPASQPGTLGRLGQYEVLEMIGEGGFGIVLKGYDLMLARVVAIKSLAPELAASAVARKRFLREARAAAAVRHDHVVSIHSVHDQPVPHLVMEYIPGVSLQQLLDASGPLPVRDLLWISSQIARGLAAAHARGLIHRDIKPGNILLETGAESRARLTDFGLACAADETGALTQSGNVAGTPLYMSPEQTRGEPLDARSDLFSLGSVMYAMATGRPPFRAGTLFGVMKAVSEVEPAPIRLSAPHTPAWLEALITRLLAKEPSQRIQTASELADLLADHLARLLPDGQLRDAEGRAPPPPAPAARTRGRKAPALIAAALAAAAGFSAWLWQSGRADRHVPGATDARFENPLGMAFIRIAPGSMMLDGGEGRPGDKPFTAPHAFFLGAHEVRQKDWLAVMGSSPSPFTREGGEKEKVAQLPDEELAELPVTGISHGDCVRFLAELNRLHPVPGWTYRLPTSKEWEFACRGGGAAKPETINHHFYLETPADTLKPDQANFDNHNDRPRRVGSYPPNALGFFDMHGNVFEICGDLERKKNGDEMLSLLKGGGWIDQVDMCQARNINVGSAHGAYGGSGLRVLLEQTARSTSPPAAP